ncbi:hypothetical protein PghCCS26_48880 [Paenibacillus glycanilyticus]|uniref:Uncharacterized protein n=1 Tax=Paenibacillus glycanilyticus TaxID=126569 RepID=A0ABQ6NRN1_9BACL|nr:hypothetical protein PghCCS26_48880 [Paenibacillus glycanilyticus]
MVIGAIEEYSVTGLSCFPGIRLSMKSISQDDRVMLLLINTYFTKIYLKMHVYKQKSTQTDAKKSLSSKISF